MSKTTDYLLEVMDRNQIEDMNELQDYFSVVQYGATTMSTVVKEKVLRQYELNKSTMLKQEYKIVMLQDEYNEEEF